jgi:hypothetical protein
MRAFARVKGREENSEQSVDGVQGNEELVSSTLKDRDGNNKDSDGPDDENHEGIDNDDSSEAGLVAVSGDEFSLDLNPLAH